MSNERKVKRVLVMIEYGEGDPDNGEVFDLTALALEIASNPDSRHNHARIELAVSASRDYASDAPKALKTHIKWQAMVDFSRSGESGYLDDAINASLPDSCRTLDLRKKLNSHEKKAEKLKVDIMEQRLRDAALVRNQYPVLRVTENPLIKAASAALPPA